MGNNVTVVGAGGVEQVIPEEDAKLLGRQAQDPNIAEARAFTGDRRKMFDNVGDKALTLAEGIVNGVSAGWLHIPGEEADLRRDVNSGSAFIGEGLGTAAGLMYGGPVRALAQAGERGGAMAARVLLRQSEKSIASKALMEAGAGITLAGSSAMGHAVLDTLVEDKPFAGEAVVDAMKLGGLLGAATGGVIGGISKLASTGKATVAGTGFAGTMADALDAHEVARASFGEALHFHEAQLGAMKELRRIGKLSEVSDDFIRVRQDAVNAARRAQAALKDVDVEAALSGKDPGLYKEAQRRWAAYHSAMDQLDGVMGIHQAERAGMAAREMDTTSGVARTTPHEPTSPVDMTDGFETQQHLTDMMDRPHPGGYEDTALAEVPDYTEVSPIPMTADDQGAAVSSLTDSVIDREAARAAGLDDTVGNRYGESGTPYWGPEYSPMRVGEDRIAGGPRSAGPFRHARLNEGYAAERVVGSGTADEIAQAGRFETGPFEQYGPTAAGVGEGPVPRVNSGGRAFPRAGGYAAKRVVGSGTEAEIAQAGRFETGPFEQFGPREYPGGLPGETGPFEYPGARGPGLAPTGETGPFAQPRDFTGPGERFQPDFRTQIDAEEAALNARAGNVQAQRAKMFRDARAANVTEPGVPKDMTEEFTGPFEGEQPLGSTNPTERIPRQAGSVDDTVDLHGDQTHQLPDRTDIARKLLDEWEAMSAARPWDNAKARAQQAMDGLFAKAGGRMTSASALGILEHEGIRPSTDLVGSYMDSVYAMNRVGRLAGAEAKGVATPLRSAMIKALGGKVSRALLGNAIGGPVGALLGFTKFGGKLAAHSASLAQAVVDSVNKALSTTATRSLVAASASISKNTPWEYSDKGPIKDPIERIQEIQFLASNPDGIRQRVLLKSGPLALVAPELVKAMQDTAVNHVQQLAIRAPAIMMNRLGFPINPPAGKMRQFFEFENAINDVGTVLDAIAKGNLTQPQADAFKYYPSVHVKAAAAYFMDPDKLRSAPQAVLRQAEMVTGVPFTAHSDPMAVVRQQTAWQPTQPTTPPAKAQAYNINPDGAPTPSQASASGRAPGN